MEEYRKVEGGHRHCWAVVRMEIIDEITAKGMDDVGLRRIEDDNEDGGVTIDYGGKSVSKLLAGLRVGDEGKWNTSSLLESVRLVLLCDFGQSRHWSPSAD
jgi:hypothetical protein